MKGHLPPPDLFLASGMYAQPVDPRFASKEAGCKGRAFYVVPVVSKITTPIRASSLQGIEPAGRTSESNRGDDTNAATKRRRGLARLTLAAVPMPNTAMTTRTALTTVHYMHTRAGAYGRSEQVLTLETDPFGIAPTLGLSRSVRRPTKPFGTPRHQSLPHVTSRRSCGDPIPQARPRLCSGPGCLCP